jgi:hypothetical protein
MREIDLDKLAGLIEPLMRFFYAMLGVSLLAVLFGSPGSALFFLIVGALAQVVRASIQELRWQRLDNGVPASPRKRPTPRPSARPATQRSAARQPAARPQSSQRRTALSR